MKKTSFIFSVLLLVFCALFLTACEKSQEKYTSSLEGKGYTVEVQEDNFTGSKFKLYATKTDESGKFNYAYIYCYETIEDCNTNFNKLRQEAAQHKSLFPDADLKVYQDGKAVYYGTAQGVSDCK